MVAFVAGLQPIPYDVMNLNFDFSNNTFIDPYRFSVLELIRNSYAYIIFY